MNLQLFLNHLPSVSGGDLLVVFSATPWLLVRFYCIQFALYLVSWSLLCQTFDLSLSYWFDFLSISVWSLHNMCLCYCTCLYKEKGLRIIFSTITTINWIVWNQSHFFILQFYRFEMFRYKCVTDGTHTSHFLLYYITLSSVFAGNFFGNCLFVSEWFCHILTQLCGFFQPLKLTDCFLFCLTCLLNLKSNVDYRVFFYS